MPLPELAAHLKSLGFDGVDLLCRADAPITPANGPARLPEAGRIFADHGLVLERLVTGIRRADAEAERLLEAIRACGVRKIRINGGYSIGSGHTFWNQLDEARRTLAALQPLLVRHGVSAGLQNHSGAGLQTSVCTTLMMVRDCDPQWIGVQYDPGHATLTGESIPMALEMLGPHLHSVNIKSPRYAPFVHPKTGRLTFGAEWVPLKDGMLDVPLLFKELARAGYAEPLSLHAEYQTHYFQVERDQKTVDALVAADMAYLKKAGEIAPAAAG